jgi:hypothetical protein
VALATVVGGIVPHACSAVGKTGPGLSGFVESKRHPASGVGRGNMPGQL